MHSISAADLRDVSASASTVSPTFCRAQTAFGLALAAGVVATLAIPGIGHGAFAWFALAPLLWASERTRSSRHVLLLGWCSGVAVNLLGFSWVVDVLRRFDSMHVLWAVLAHLGFSIYQGLSWGISLWAGEKMARRVPSCPRWAAMTLSFAVCEWAFPLVMPWTLGVTQVDNLPILQFAEFGGAHGLTALVIVVNTALVDLLGQDARRRLSWLPFAMATAIAGWGAWRVTEIDGADLASPQVKVGAVRSNLPAGVQLDPRAHLASLRSASDQLAAHGAELIVWSETTYPYSLPSAWSRDFGSGQAARVRGNFKVPLMFGAATVGSGPQKGLQNSAYLLAPEGHVVGRYDKRALVPFGEKVPFDDIFPSLRALRMEAAGNYSAGYAQSLLSTQAGGFTLRIAPLICFDDLFPNIARDHVRQDAHALVSLSNDAWFGASAEPEQHLASAILRSVETRRPMVRVVNAGPSALVSASGKVTRAPDAITKRAEHELEGVIFEVPVTERAQTWHTAHGPHTDLLFAGLFAVWMFIALAAPHLPKSGRFCAPRSLDEAMQIR